MRLRRRAEFLGVQQAGRKLHTESFLVFVRPRAQPGPTRIGITTSRKVGGAVERNRIKRRLREAFRRRRLLFPLGLDLVFIAKRGAVEASYDHIAQEIERLCRRYFRN